MKPEVIAGIALLVCCLSSSSAGGAYFIMNSSPEPEPEAKVPETKKVPEPEKVKGCTDPNANNTSPDAEEDDGSCLYDRKAVMKFTATDGTPGCLTINYQNLFQQAPCSPELEQAELDVITNSVGGITDVKTCFYPYPLDENINFYTAVANDETSRGNECRKYKISEEDTSDTIGGVPIYAYGDANSPQFLLTTTENLGEYGYVPVKLQLI